MTTPITDEELARYVAGHDWIRVRRWQPDRYEGLQERYDALEVHHAKETEFLIAEIRRLALALRSERDERG